MAEQRFKSHPIFARFYKKMSSKAEERGQAGHRKELLAGLSGRVLELGAGNGLNFTHYPATVTEVIAVEPEPTLRAAAEEAAANASVPVRVVNAVADDLPFADGELDAAVASLVLCSVPDQASALAEVKRVLRPGGELRFYEHVQSRKQPAAAFLTFADRTFWPRIAGGCHPARHTGEAIERAGFEVEECRRFGFSPGSLVPKTPHIIGRARRPA
jgi:ubiquinone/menaquinone biosynthesis C-methylase UbiE